MRPLIENDYPHLLRIYRNTVNMKYIPVNRHLQEDDQLIEIWRKNTLKQGAIYGINAISLKTGILVGEIGLYNIPDTNNTAEIGIILDSKYWEKGLRPKHLFNR
ncbi:GNAT family N-acetyltransferase [Halosquirtibacter laminarini]|uniref:GNAT family N-acetyltransferase n=1 Tax=Halosquirtibacter laminarini TaxID=3374600 RepID=A0AC61NMX0_9BACT|nr:GNAT family N-acetyltransferase [Prolixibacteraceae bacterium]